ncbi:MAG TPA: hypothetical protein VIV15_10360, partial [Anaerolineales bacterium]
MSDEWTKEEEVEATEIEGSTGCVGELTMDEVILDQLRQAVYERAGRMEDISNLLSRLNATDWIAWLND